MISSTQRALSLIGIVAIFTTTAASQQVPTITTSPLTWQHAKYVMEYRKVDLVTVAKPASRKHCNVSLMDEKSITCSSSFGGPQTYARADLEAIIVRAQAADHPHLSALLPWVYFGSIFGGIGYGIYLLALLGPAGAAAAGVLALFSACTFAMGLAFSSGESAPPPSTALPEAIVYVKPGTTYRGISGDQKMLELKDLPSSGTTPNSAASSLPSAS